MNITINFPRIGMDVKENFLFQLYSIDIHNAIRNYDGLAEKIADGETDELKCRVKFHEYIRNQIDYLNDECSKHPDIIYPGFNESFNAIIFLQDYLDSDPFLNKGICDCIQYRYVLSFLQLANISLVNADHLFKKEIEIISSQMEMYLEEKQDIGYAVEANFYNIKKEIIERPDEVHSYCEISYNEYLRLKQL